MVRGTDCTEICCSSIWVSLDHLSPFHVSIHCVGRINILEYSLVVVSVLSVGHISTSALAAITIGEMSVNVTGLSIIMGFASALDTVLPSAWTSERPELVGLWTQRMMLIVSLTLMPIIALWLNAEAVLLKLNQEPEVARLAAVYLRYMCIGIPGASCCAYVLLAPTHFHLAFAFNCVSRCVTIDI